jgi:AcrR family transcriptional regulator
MSKLREKQRRARELAIKQAADQLFQERGYSVTNVEDIAARAEVGVATVYKYFGSKSGVLREIMRPDLLSMHEAGELVLVDPPLDPADAVVQLLFAYQFRDHWAHKDLIRAMAGVDFGYGGAFEELRREVDSFVMEQLGELLNHAQRRGAVRSGLDTEDMATIIYAMLNHNFQLYVRVGDMPTTVFQKNLRRHILLLFQGWRTVESGTASKGRIKREKRAD